MKIRWIGQSGYILSDGITEICIDPYLSDIVNKVAGRERIVDAPVLPQNLLSNAVIITHNHLDHLDTDAIEQMNKSNMTFYAPTDCEKALTELGVTNYVAFNEGMVYNIGDFTIEAVYADHTVPAIGVILTHNGKVLYFSGDTYYNDKLRQLKKYGIDFMFICINGKLGNMNVSEAVKLTQEIQPKTAIPNHYGMFESNTENPHNFTDNLNNGFIMDFNKEYEVQKCLI